MVRITEEEISPETIYRELGTSGAGSVVFHYSVVKPQETAGGTTCHVEFRMTEEAEEELQQIAEDLKGSYVLRDVLLVRRSGRVPLGEIISLVAASSPNSEDAFEACKAGIIRLKKMKSVEKKEVCS
ncbi:molybdenum cofactor biosynthesis protein MoaE [Geomonas sp. RF6]|uniref:molybdenum cofactor biosynthesis protein MoaE n=1 Tax=Geomonas sp. RF6 TaxID=2897342 RepID=UPI001E55EBDB|nr:molybdenum cofactor biosynthesis protein MoaE [Geomonas sp. RF6]UFS71659.1 molybdenum cofactor biosynthesis protein MoaE [Geomonas sp. RF6]